MGETSSDADHDGRTSMLRRFSLYGFLKNQQYFEPFLILALRDKGLSFLVIGLLISFREAMVNVFEIPSGALADVWGRRRVMILSFCGYIASFLIFGFSRNLPLLFLAMLFFGIGDAFRTGTHKAMIFTWLRLRGTPQDGTRVYGYTRSWSQIGSAVSVLLAAPFVFLSDGYVHIFTLSVIPYLAGIINFLGYPRELDGDQPARGSSTSVVSVLKDSILACVKNGGLRRLIVEAMGFQGVFKAVQTYLQPILKAAAVVVMARFVVTSDLNEPQQAALLVGPVYFVLHVLSAVASRQSHQLIRPNRGEEPTARWLWTMNLLVFAALVPAAYYDQHALLIAGFIFLFVLQNLWRPLYVSRFAQESGDASAATLLSIESQARSAATMIVAPILGYAVDLVQKRGLGGAYWPATALGLVVALVFLVTTRKRSAPVASPLPEDQPVK